MMGIVRALALFSAAVAGVLFTVNLAVNVKKFKYDRAARCFPSQSISKTFSYFALPATMATLILAIFWLHMAIRGPKLQRMFQYFWFFWMQKKMLFVLSLLFFTGTITFGEGSVGPYYIIMMPLMDLFLVLAAGRGQIAFEVFALGMMLDAELK